ncbi:zinc finger bed domain-containing protein 1-like [Gigaspora margarita]|uniref:Zinc finger bed domain-containing protein 1-like n=1 Tax=Gigaspora margarita TaxID=4874 RepID=A0A8H3X1B4_GIGMA|nr:zinc finger bed domain-containing protein 1-like [Gigaspora margarita]
MGGNYDIWKHFTKIGPDKNFKQGCAQYNYCNHKCNESVVSCKGHLKVCEHANLETKQQYFGPTFQETVQRNLVVNINRQINTNIQNFYNRISQSEQNDIELSVA